MQLVILCGGLATRLGSQTENRPKSMINVSGKPFLEYQLDTLREGGVKNIVLCIGHFGEQIEDYFGDGSKFGVSIAYSRETEGLLGTGGALKNAESYIDDQFFVMYGDSYLFLDYKAIMAHFNTYKKTGLMVVYQNRDLYDRSNVIVEGDMVKIYSKSDKHENMKHIDYGASILSKKVLKNVSSGEPASLEKLFGLLVDRNELLAYEVYERFYEIGSPQGLREFEGYVAKKGENQ